MTILPPIAPNKRRSKTVLPFSLPAPIGGWNAKDALSDMPPTDAVMLVNWFPETDSIRLRAGFEDHTTGITGPVESLMPYSSGTADELYAAANNEIYDVTISGAVGAADVTSLTNNRWQFVNFGTTGGNFLFIVNGADAPRHYNGTSWATPSITGITTTDVINVQAHQRRLFFVLKDSLEFAYLPIESVAGAAATFDLGPLATLGGELTAIGTWTIDGGAGVDDVAVFLTSKGEAIVYQGTNPGDATTWTLVGVYRLGEPIGRRCFLKLGGDLVIVTQDGFIPLSSSLITARINQKNALSDKISGVVNDAVKLWRSNFGWQAIFYPRRTMAIFNIPRVENSTADQYVLNTTTGAFCQFQGMDASCWAVFNDDLYFGGSTKVLKADTGTADGGINIESDAKQAFNYFNPRSRLKHFQMIRPILSSNGPVQPAIELNVDFEDKSPASVPTSVGLSGSEWDADFWDEGEWGGSDDIIKSWTSVSSVGFAAAMRMKIQTKTLEATWKATDFLYKLGDYI